MRLSLISSLLFFTACSGDGIKGPAFDSPDDSAVDDTPTTEDCVDQIDNDVDGFVDCDDEECLSELHCVDEDGDGFTADTDCDDTDPNTYPGAAENESPLDCMTDSDGDGYGDEESPCKWSDSWARLR